MHILPAKLPIRFIPPMRIAPHKTARINPVIIGLILKDTLILSAMAFECIEGPTIISIAINIARNLAKGMNFFPGI